MSYDLYAAFRNASAEKLAAGKYGEYEIKDMAARIHLLVGVDNKGAAVGEYRGLVHPPPPKDDKSTAPPSRYSSEFNSPRDTVTPGLTDRAAYLTSLLPATEVAHDVT